MLKKIHAMIPPRLSAGLLACALALFPSPAALAEYNELCLFNQGGYTASFIIEFTSRNSAPRHGRESYGGGTISGQTKCVSLRDADLRAGDAFRFFVNPVGDINSKGTSQCGPNRDRARGHEGLFLVPDGPKEGRLTFKSWGGLYHTKCELEHSGVERMHSVCGASRNGMDNPGCNRFELDQKWLLGTKSNTQLPQSVTDNATLGQFFDLIDRGRYDVDQSLPNGATAAHIVAEKGLGAHLDLLIERGANLDARRDDGSTPIMVAMASRRFDMAEKLADAGANPDFAREDGQFPLYYAAEQGSPAIVQILLDSGALFNALHAGNDQSPLEAAAARGDRDRDAIVNLLISYGAEHRIHLEEIPNIVATDGGLDKLARALDEGLDVNQSTGDEITGLHIAAAMNRSDYAELLLEHGADANLQDNQGRTPLMTAIEAAPDYPAVVQVLLFEGADPNIGPNDGSFPLYLAVELALNSVVDMLLFFGDDTKVNQRNANTGKTALGLTVEKYEQERKSEHAIIRESLLNFGAAR